MGNLYEEGLNSEEVNDEEPPVKICAVSMTKICGTEAASTGAVQFSGTLIPTSYGGCEFYKIF